MSTHQSQWPVRFEAALLVAGLSAALAGCASSSNSYSVNVDAVADVYAPPATTYALVSRDPTRPARDFYYPEVVDRVRVILYRHGLEEAVDPAKADLLIEIDYGERAPRTEVTTVNQPVLLPPDPVGTNTVGYPQTTSPGVQIGIGNPQYPGSYPYPNQTGRTQVVMQQQIQVRNLSEKFIRLTARPNPKTQAPGTPQSGDAWAIEAVVEDETTDARTCLPALIEGASDYVGTNTNGRQKVVVRVVP